MTPELTPTLRGCCTFLSPSVCKAAPGPWIRLTNDCNCTSMCSITLQVVLSRSSVLGKDGRCSKVSLETALHTCEELG